MSVTGHRNKIQRVHEAVPEQIRSIYDTASEALKLLAI